MRKKTSLLSQCIADKKRIKSILFTIRKRNASFLFLTLFLLFTLLSLHSIYIMYANPYITSYYPSGYNLLDQTQYVSGALTDLESNNAIYMTFRSYASATTATTLYTHQDLTAINSINYRTLKTTSADASGTTLTASMASAARTLIDKAVYPLTDITNITASTWTFYYRAWKDADPSIAYDAQSSRTQSNSQNYISWSHTTGSGNNRLLLVTINIYRSGGTPTTCSGCTYNGVVMTQVVTNVYTTNPQVRSYIYRLTNPASGTLTVRGNFSASTVSVGGAVSYSGVDQTTPIQANNSAIGSGTSQSVSVTVSGNGRAVYGSLASYRTTTPTSYTITDGSGQNHRWGQTGQTYKGHGDDKLNVSPSVVSISWTTSQIARYVCCAVAINPATPSAGHCDVDILIRQSNGTVRTTIATNVATSGAITTAASTLSGTYSWSSYTVIAQTDYLEIDYYADTTTACQGTNANLRIDDNTLATTNQTRIENISLPSEFTSEVYFEGTSNTQSWTQIVWEIDSAWTIDSATITLQLYNYTFGGYPTSGDGYISYTSSPTPNTDETKNQTITVNPMHFRDSLGNWRIKVKGVKLTTTQFDFKADLIRFEVTYVDVNPPTWSSAGTNNTLAGQPTLFYVKWTDDFGLSGFIFGTNNTGTWTNDTWVSMSGVTNWSNVTKILNGTARLVQWRVWANDTSNNWNDTGILSLTLSYVPTASFTYSPSTPLTGETVTFNASTSYDSDGSIMSYFWNFGDGANGTGMVITHAYPDNGVYTITLTVTDNDGLTDTDTQNITVLNRPPAASFTESATSVPTGTAIYFNASSSYDSDGSVVSYFWDFGDGTNGTGVTIQHTYADNGTYAVTLTVTDNDGATATATATKIISNRPPVASFTESATTVYTGEIIYFNASASYDPDGSIISYLWNFGDGANATGVVVSHAYVDNGTYNVTLTVTDNDGATASINAVKTVLNRAPVASFTESATTVLTNEVIYFNASGSYDPDGTIISFFWTFGDGTNATGVAVSHGYSDNGTYLVTLIVTDNDGAVANTTATKTVLNRSPVAIFSESAETVYIGQPITFNASNSYDPDGTVVNYFWNFGDGTNATGMVVSHAYNVNGTFTVTLTTTDNDGASNSTSANKTVLWNNPPIALFTESPETVYTNDLITFNASASYDPDGTIVGYFWDFGDGTNTTGAVVTHAYIDDGLYTVTLTVTDNLGATGSTSIAKTVLDRPPVASFTETAETVLTGEVIYFNASASYDPDGTILSYRWDFGDGNITTVTTPIIFHAYVDNGTYTVTLTVTDDDGSTASTSSSKTVLNRPPTASFTYSPSTPYTGQTVTFNATASYDLDGSIVNYTWNFGDGNITTVTTQIITHAYVDNGTYTVTLTITDNDGATSLTSASITILNRPPIASFIESATTVYTGDVISFNASTSYDPDGSIVSYFWTFGDGTNATGLLVTHAYSENGTYTVTLTVTDNDGAIASTSATKTVLNRSPVASFSESTTTAYTGEVIYFNASTSYDPDGSIVSYFWNFGDGTNATGMTASHAYANNGLYNVTLTVTDNDGATASASAVKTILNRAPVASFTESATTVLTNELIYFNASGSSDPDGNIVNFFWNFGDGINATGISVSHAYADDGVYTVTLTVTDDDGATASDSAPKTVLNRPPIASFTESAETALTGETITFNASSSYDPDGTIVSFFWDFGDGTNATGITVSHVYVDDGTFVVTLTVTDDDGIADSATATKTILNRAPIASFTESAETVFKGEIIYFNASGSYDPDGYIANYFWTFGDGTNATGVTANHSYANAGNYTVTLTVTDNDGATAIQTATKTVLNRSPVASFTESATTVFTGEVISFNASDSYDLDGSIISYFWDFGDGTNATGVAVSHAYLDDGNYTVTLIVTDNDGATATASATKNILNRLPTASFTESAETVYTGETITFNASNSFDPDGTIVSYSWDFGDGNITTVTTSIITHAYADNGTYTVTLTVTDDDDGATASASSTKTVLNRSPIASFTYSPPVPYTGEAVTFNASASYDLDGSIVSYMWDFGDGNVTTVTTGTITHVYVDNATYTVTLTITDNDGATNLVSTSVTILNRRPVASFTESATTVFTYEVISFNASLSYDPDGSITTYLWDFGDGTNATGVTVQHAYANNGIYTVTLTVTDNDGETGIATATKTVLNQQPVASFTENATTVLTGVTINFNASDSYDPDGFIASFFWDFGDGTNGTGIVVDHAYLDDGIYTVTLTVTDDDGATATANATKTVFNRSPVASFTASKDTALTGEIIVFNASDSYDSDGVIASYLWDFGDGSNATGVTVEHAYAENGIYTVTLTVTDDDGATGTASTTITILNRSPVASFTESATSVDTGVVIYFNASASYDPDGSIVSYFWDFGDGTNATGVTAEHAYSTRGVYNVTLTVTDNDGATSLASVSVTISNRHPIASFTESATTVYTYEVISFNASSSYDPDGFIVSFFWDFGDGSNATGITAEHAYTENGIYTVTLIVTDNDGETGTATATKTVLNQQPVASFTENATTVLTGVAISFNASDSYDPDGIIVSFFWSFGDGTNANGVIVDHTYLDDGIYTVILTITDDDGATATANATKTVLNRSPIASFTASKETALTNEIIVFNASSSYDLDGIIVSFFWDFGDGSNATGMTVEYDYAENGIYTVTLTVTDDDGATGTTSKTITVQNRPPVASFTESATTVDTGIVIYFNASASYDPDGTIVSYFWDFGDGTNATGVTAEHAYSTSGVYNVTLIVTDNDGATGVAIATKYVQNRPPGAFFTYSPTFPVENETVSFDASASYDPDGFIVSYQWDFGDGNVTTVTSPIITHVYYAYGNYTVTLTITDNDGYTSATSKIVGIRDYPTAVFTYSPSFPIAGETVTFNASSSVPNGGVITSYLWNFGDGTSLVNTTNPTITHVYSTNGNFTVTLTVADSEGLTNTKTDTVRIRDYPSASYTFSPGYPTEGEIISFDASLSTPNGGAIVSYQWNFGDGNITTLATPTITHVYSAIGNYTVTLTVMDSEGLNSSLSKIVSIRGYPIAVFTYTPTAPYVGDTVTFNASLSSPNGGTIINYMWDFGDGSPIYNTTNPIATHIYNVSGNYTVTLTITDSEGLNDTDTHFIAVAKAPIAAFTYSPEIPKIGETVTFNASASYDPNGYIANYTWNFGDGNITVVTTPVITHVYTSTGTYTVILTVTDNSGYTDTATAAVVLGNPKASFNWTPQFPIVWQSITFNASASYDPNGYIVSYIWNFGDGNITTVTSPIIVHVYNATGNFTVTLTVADNQGLTDTTIKTVSVGKAPEASFTFAPASPYVGDTVTFNASSSTPSSGNITSYVWNFGDGSPIENKTTFIITHVYQTAGNCTVTLTITDSAGLSNTATKQIIILQSPVAAFTHSPTYPQAFDTVTFNASASYDSNGYIVSYVWNFGDGNVTTVTSSIITHAYNSAGNFTVVLIVADNEGYTHSLSKNLYVSLRPPVADFTGEPSFPIVNQSVTFNASSSYDLDGSIVSYIWDFGDGNVTTVTSSIIVHQYFAYGNYTVALTVVDNDNLTDVRTSLVRVRGYPTAAFTYTPTIPDVGSNATFNASSSVPNGGVILYYLWNFGDGSPLTNTTNSIITHIFNAAANYTVTLTVVDNENLNNTASQTVYVTELPTASFNYSPSSPYVGDIVTFNASNSYDLDGYIVRYLWDFGDGSPLANETDPITTHIYVAGGSYTVRLTVIDNSGFSDETTLIITIGKMPVAAFIYTPASPLFGDIITFNASGSYDIRRAIANYTWNFGDGNITTVTAPIITHLYAVEGSYNVSLTVTDVAGYFDTITQTVTVRNYPIANFTISPSYPIGQEMVTFDASSTNPRGGVILSYLWDFGDGSPKINTTYPIWKYVYAAVGEYNVTLTVADSEGLVGTIVKTLKVRDYPTASFTFSPSSPTAGVDPVTFNASSSTPNHGVITSYRWDFGDGNTTTVTAPVIIHVYARSGNYTIILTVTDDEGLSDSAVDMVSVKKSPPIAAFTYSPVFMLTDEIVTFNASSSRDPDGSIVSYLWDFGDGNITTVTTPIAYHTYTAIGDYTMVLKVIDNDGLNATVSYLLRVREYPVASFTWSPQEPKIYELVTFNASSSTPGGGVIISYEWNFGDGNITIVSDPIVTHYYQPFGEYTVTLTVTNNEGLPNTKSNTFKVIAPPNANFTWSPTIPRENETVTFNASTSIPNGGMIAFYIWNFGDGTPPVLRTYQPIITHNYVTLGNYTVTLTVIDSENLNDTVSKIITIGSSPSADFTWFPPNPQALEIITFNASISSPNGGAITSYRWDFGDGNITTVTVSVISHRFSTSGSYLVILNVTDSEGFWDNESKTVSVTPAVEPYADFVWSPLSPFVNETIMFNASASTPNGGVITSYKWDFGDSVLTTTDPIVYHSYLYEGNYTVKLTVTDSQGLNSTASKVIRILPLGGPTANFVWLPLLPNPNQTITLNASSSTLGWNGTYHPPIVSYIWNFGDGNTTTVTTPTITHKYANLGNYTVTLTITDALGRTDAEVKTVEVVEVTLKQFDVNGDGFIDVKDILMAALAYGATPGDPKWEPRADVNGDGFIDIKDILAIALHYGEDP